MKQFLTAVILALAVSLSGCAVDLDTSSEEQAEEVLLCPMTPYRSSTTFTPANNTWQVWTRWSEPCSEVGENAWIGRRYTETFETYNLAWQLVGWAVYVTPCMDCYAEM